MAAAALALAGAALLLLLLYLALDDPGCESTPMRLRDAAGGACVGVTADDLLEQREQLVLAGGAPPVLLFELRRERGVQRWREAGTCRQAQSGAYHDRVCVSSAMTQGIVISM